VLSRTIAGSASAREAVASDTPAARATSASRGLRMAGIGDKATTALKAFVHVPAAAHIDAGRIHA
jgi:hypothetical protein